ncbi:MAG: cyclic pyranopterin monophosphate synthase MoaC [Parvibaculales bacterium]
MSKLSHIDKKGQAAMVDISKKQASRREAIAISRLVMAKETLKLAIAGNAPKGDIFAPARLGGIMAAKRTSELIPLCHPIALSHIEVEIEAEEAALTVIARVVTNAPTGVEMEALVAASTAGLILYDMLKAIDKNMYVEQIRLLKKTGGKNGDFIASDVEQDEIG